ncbi:MAG: ABC transporter ATP-binding protein, partial [Trebonia sp.]
VERLVIRVAETTAVADISFAVGTGERVTLLGPSGCGKTTMLRSIAGLERPSSGIIRVNGTTVFSSAERRHVAAERRGVSMVFQSYAIWPHMTVAENVAYGLSVRRLPRHEIERGVGHALDLVQMRAYAERAATKLSGGQQQRVAVARAIAFSPSVLLFDEPLSNLDAKLRAEMRVELRELQRRLGITSLYVTHDQEEALAISDRIIVMNAGRIEQIGTPEEIYDRPRSRFVADFVGSANLIGGRIVGERTGDGWVTFEAAGGLMLKAVAHAPPEGATGLVALHAAHVSLGTSPAAGPAGDGTGNTVLGTIRRRMFHGDFIQYLVDWPAGQLIVRRPPTEIFEEGRAVTVSFAPERCVLVQGAAEAEPIG